MLRVPRCGDVAVWAVIGGTVLLVVAQIVATKTLSKGIGRSARNESGGNVSYESMKTMKMKER